MSYILHIDTSGKTGIIAISQDGKLLGEMTNTEEKDHASVINLMIDDVLAKARISLGDIHAISVMGGPGSYTGLRIGLATAKALCYVLDIPLMMDNKLDLITLQQQVLFSSKYDFYIGLLPARDREYFFTILDGSGKNILAPSHVMDDELLKLSEVYMGSMIFSGQLNDRIKELCAKMNADWIENDKIDLGFWSAHSFENFKRQNFVNLANSEPFYLKQVFTHNSK